MQKAVGAIIVAIDTGRILLNKRSENVTYSNYWAFIGGKVEAEEYPVSTLYRELKEEINLDKNSIDSIKEINVFVANSTFTYYSFVVFVLEEFIPKLNIESCGYAWITFNNWPRYMHPGAYAVLNDLKLEDIKKGA